MDIEQALLAAIRALPADRQQEVLDFAAFLGSRDGSQAAAPRPDSLCAGEFLVPADFDTPLPDDVVEQFSA